MRVGTDIGGTFTDYVSMDEDGKIVITKSSTTPKELTEGVHNCFLKAGKTDMKDVEQMLHGSTTAINTLIERKGATYYAIALSVCRILEAVAGNEQSVLTVSSHLDGFMGVSGVSLSLPAVIAREGVRELLPISLDPGEREGLLRSAGVLRDFLAEIGY